MILRIYDKVIIQSNYYITAIETYRIPLSVIPIDMGVFPDNSASFNLNSNTHRLWTIVL